MKFGVREICDVVLRAKSAMKIGNKVFYKNEPVLYFDTLKTSALENAINTVYAQGGRGNARLIAWEGEKTITFTMEDALISPMGLSVLTGAGLVKAEEKSIIVHKTEVTTAEFKDDGQASGGTTTTHFNYYKITLKEQPYKVPSKYNEVNPSEDFIYVMLLDDDGEIISEPYIASETFFSKKRGNEIFLTEENIGSYQSDDYNRKNDLSKFYDGCQVLVDYYTEVIEKAYQVNITPEDFNGNFYLEASTLFRASSGIDMPAEFIIPNCKIQSNFTFTMASSGDPTTFNFIIDAFPDYTRWNKDKKVFAAIQVIESNEITSNLERLGTPHNYKSDKDYNPFLTYKKEQEQYITDEPEELLNDMLTSIDKDGNIYNELGYKKNTILEIISGPGYNITNDASQVGYLVTGYIPYSYGQDIHITGLKKEENNLNNQKIYFYYNLSGALIGVEEGSYLFSLQEKNNSLTYNPIENASEDFHDISSIGSVKYIRICFYNTKLSEIAVLVSGNPVEPSRNIEPDNEEENNNDASTRSILLDNTSNSSEPEDDSIDELLAYLEEQEQEEEENR